MFIQIEKPTKEKITEVPSVLGPSTSVNQTKISEEKRELSLTSFDGTAGPYIKF